MSARTTPPVSRAQMLLFWWHLLLFTFPDTESAEALGKHLSTNKYSIEIGDLSSVRIRKRLFIKLLYFSKMNAIGFGVG